jgi:hypothetical protein
MEENLTVVGGATYLIVQGIKALLKRAGVALPAAVSASLAVVVAFALALLLQNYQVPQEAALGVGATVIAKLLHDSSASVPTKSGSKE